MNKFKRQLIVILQRVDYATFAAAMTCGRLAGDRLTASLGLRRMLQLGSTFAIVGILGLISFEDRLPLLLSFVSIGFGLANIVPTLFLTIAKQKDMPVSSAMPIAATLGYTGTLCLSAEHEIKITLR
ncbi:hypothetical protein PTKU46_85800 [Paraburkholderia terrae]|uniref:hypothetical protein n=1 Tax=Paraburkholderia terrae TaxID=311230 RepID=UPI0030DF7968